MLAIVLTAPAGAVAISLLGPLLLEKDGEKFDDDEDDDEDDEREGGEGRSVSVEDRREMNGEKWILLIHFCIAYSLSSAYKTGTCALTELLIRLRSLHTAVYSGTSPLGPHKVSIK